MKNPTISRLLTAAAATALVAVPAFTSADARTTGPVAASVIAVGPQYDTTHVYVPPEKMASFIASWKATFGGTSTEATTVDVTPTPSETRSELVLSPVGTLSVFGFLTPVPHPFGSERTGWLLKDFDRGLDRARASGADVVVAPWKDPIGRDVVVQFPGGVNTQLYWHTSAPSYPRLATLPENRLYISPDAVNAFLRSYLAFTGGTVVADDSHADAGEIGRPGESYRRITTSSAFGETLVMVTDGHLPYPFGHETTGYKVARFGATLSKAEAAGAKVLWGPHSSKDRKSAVLEFPGGYVAEIHSTTSP